MTTLSLGVNEWRKLVQANLEQAFEFTQSKMEISVDDARSLAQHLDRMKALVMAWHASTRPQVASEPVQQTADPEPVAEQPKKRGWPKGRPRKRNAPQQVMQ